MRPLESCKSTTIEIGTTATEIAVPGGYNSVTILNASTTPIYLGGSGVTVAEGFPIGNESTCADTSISMDVRNGKVFAIASSAVTVRVICGF